MDISNRCGPGLGYPKLQKSNHGYLLSGQSRYGISQKLKRYTYECKHVWFIHGLACDNQRYPWYISKRWYIPGISLMYAKTRKLINGYQIPDAGHRRRGISWHQNVWCQEMWHVFLMPRNVVSLMQRILAFLLMPRNVKSSESSDHINLQVNDKSWKSFASSQLDQILGMRV